MYTFPNYLHEFHHLELASLLMSITHCINDWLMFDIQCSPFSAHTIELDNLKLEAATYSKSRHQSGEETPGKRQTNSHCGDRKNLPSRMLIVVRSNTEIALSRYWDICKFQNIKTGKQSITVLFFDRYVEWLQNLCTLTAHSYAHIREAYPWCSWIHFYQLILGV